MDNKRNEKKIGWILLISIFIIFVIPPFICFAEDRNVWLILPGTKVGWVKIGETDIRSVIKQFGDLDGLDKEKGQVLYRKRYGLDFMYDTSSNKVTSVMISKQGSGGVTYKTNKDVAIGSPGSSVMQAWGEPSLLNNVRDYNVISYFRDDRFITFFVNKKGYICLIWTGMKNDYEKFIEEIKSSLK